jgi:RNA polymerase sigma factor (sigma-70 family)
MANPIGYLVRVGQSRSRRYIRWETAVHLPVESYSPAVPDVGLHTSLAQLRPDRRAALLLVYSYHYSYAETAELLGIRVSTVRNHLQRGLRQLRRDMKDETDADDS